MTFSDRNAPSGGRDAEQTRLLSHLFALAAVAVAAIVRYALGVAGAAVPFAFFHASVALSALRGGWPAALVATLASLLVARVSGGAALGPSIAFVLEALVIAGVTIRVSDLLRLQRRRTTAADDLLRELKTTEQRELVVGAAFGRLQEAAGDLAIVLLDEAGRIHEWGVGAGRMYRTREAPGTSASLLFSPILDDEELAHLLSAARQGPVLHRSRHRRGDGTEFEVDCEFSRLLRGRFSGFTMIVSDRSRQEAWQAFAQSAAHTEGLLREEADVAHQQLATLQYMTDPSLDLEPTTDVLGSLLDRLRPAVGADGIACVPVGSARDGVVYATDGLRGSGDEGRSNGGPRRHGPQPGYTLLIHNDPHRVAELSIVAWPDATASLIAVPVVRAGVTLAVLEVVYLRGRRSTEWDIALIQVVAARIAGVLKSDADLSMPGQYAVDHFA